MTSYQVLARKWRPQTFADVAGQESVVRTLQRALDTGRVAHAFLFTGSRGIGKTTLARVLAKSLSCETGITSAPCGACTMCTEITEGKCVDVIEIDGASNTGVDDVRELREVARFLPQRGRFKVFIIDEVHMLSTGAFNALLKTLEEPPPHVKFIFATTEAHKIPVTILSRCQRYDFKRIPTKTIVERLRHVLQAEGIRIDDGGLTIIARAAEGGMRDALSLTDQVIAFAGEAVDADGVTEALGLIDRRSVVRATAAVIDRDARQALALIEEAYARGHDIKQLSESVTLELRHLSVSKATGTLAGFADLAPEDIAEIDAMASELDGRELQRLFFMALEGTDLLARSDEPRLALELLFLRMCDRPAMGEAAAISDAISRLDALARGKPVPPPQAPAGPAVTIARESLGARVASAPAPSPPTTSLKATTASPSLSPPSPTDDRAENAPPEASPGPAAHPRSSTVSAPPAPPPRLDHEETLPRPQVPATRVPPPHVDGGAPTPQGAPTSSTNVSANEVPSWMLEAPPPESPELTKTSPPPPEPPEEEELDEEEPEEAFDPSLGYLLEGIDPRWIDLVRSAASQSKHLAAHLAHGRFLGSEKRGKSTVLTVLFERRPNLDTVEQANQRGELKDALGVFGAGAKLETRMATEGDAAPPSIATAQREAALKAQRDLEAHARAHPVVQKALDLFGGEVRQVRRDR
ncbi:MAG: DNA polymerase III subunit gamma/tau [Myxococcota bacterium]